jgi:putative flippase GtrA
VSKASLDSTRQLMARLLAFGLVGGVGFVVDAGVLQLLFSQWGMSPLGARAISFPLAVTATWILNKHVTFRDRAPGRSGRGYALYFVGQIMGALVNVAVFIVALRIWPQFADRPLIPLAFGSAVAMFFNYLWSSLLVFGKPPAGTPEDLSASSRS